MEAIRFPEATKDMGAPPGMTKEECFDLPVNEGFYFIRGFNPVACLTSCWVLTDEDWMKWKPIGGHFDDNTMEEYTISDEYWMGMKPKEPKVYLTIMGFGMPPVSLSVDNPFKDGFDKSVGAYYHQHGKFPEEYQKQLQKEKDELNNSAERN